MLLRDSNLTTLANEVKAITCEEKLGMICDDKAYSFFLVETNIIFFSLLKPLESLQKMLL